MASNLPNHGQSRLLPSARRPSLTGTSPKRTLHGHTCSRESSSRSFSVYRSVAIQTQATVVLAGVGRGDWILCQVTSNPYGDPLAIPEESFDEGSLRIDSFARSGKLFTASAGLMLTEVGTLKSVVSDSDFLARIRSLSPDLRQA